MIETPRLSLRPHTLPDFEPWHAMFTDAEVLRFLAIGALSREDAWHRLLRYAGHWALLGFGVFAVFERSTGRFVGEVGFADFHRGLGPRFDGSPEASWMFVPTAQGQGYASEAIVAALHWMDARPLGRRTVCIVNPSNSPSLRIAAKLGYVPFDSCIYKGAPYTMLERQAN